VETQRLGRYEILTEIGRGAMGRVYQARDPKIDRIVALKTISVLGATPADQEEYRQRFFREAQAAGKLAHPGIVIIYDVGEDEATHTPFIVMEYIAGRTLDELGSGGALSVDVALDLIRQVAEALDYAHSQGIIHRDIKPANIIITEDGRAKITDFGIAKLTLSEFTVPGQVLGTPTHMSPEQLQGHPVTGRSDLFSLGVILYSLLTSEKPFSGDTVTSVTFQVVYKDPPPVTAKNAALRPEFDLVLARALAKDPLQRYPRGRDFAHDLDDLRQGRPPRWASSGTLPGAADRTVARGTVPVPPVADRTVRTTPGEQATQLRGSTETTLVVPRPPGGPSLAQNLLALFKLRAVQVSAAILVLGLIVAGWTLARRGPSAGGSEHGGLTPSFGEAAPSNLAFRCSHDFRAAEFSVWVDDDLILVGKLTSRKHDFSQTVHVPSGSHTVRVQIKGEGYDQTREIKADLPPDGTLAIRATPDKSAGTLTLEVQ
jgi:predicted Ser/Thr protein kinase